MSNNPNDPLTDQPGAARLADRLQRMMKSERGASARVINFGIMEDGHAGLTFGFDLVDPDGAPLGSYVLKTAPVGVTRRGNTDVFRQAPLLRALKQAGLPVPEIPWASPDEDRLGTPFLVMERMPGRVFLVWEPHASFSRDDAQSSRHLAAGGAAVGTGAYGRLATGAARLGEASAIAGGTRPLDERPAPRAGSPLVGRRHRTRRSCWHRGLPDEAPVGVVHGDFQPGNILYVNGKPAD